MSRFKVRRYFLPCGLIGLFLFAAAVNAEVLHVSAPVLSVEPIKAQPKPVCDVPEPAQDVGLAATLRWDLRGRCRESAEQAKVTGYAVEYEWDGRRFTTVMPEPPTGDRLALRLQLQ